VQASVGKLDAFKDHALTNDNLGREPPAIVGCRMPSALAHAATTSGTS
jgi:hypothetical protein